MPENSKLLAWIEACDGDAFLAAFVGKPAANHRAPAIQVCASPDEARQRVTDQATALGLPVSR